MTQQEDRLKPDQARLLRERRRERGFSQQYIARLLNVSRQWYNAIEQGQASLGNEDRRTLARTLGILPSVLGVSGGPVIQLPAGDLVRVLWDQFYGGTAPGMLGLVPYGQLWLDEQPQTPGPESGTISQLYQAVASALQDAALFKPALAAADKAVVFGEHLSGPREPNADACTAYYRRSRIFASMAQATRGEQRQVLLGQAMNDATTAAARAPADRLALKVVSLQNLADLQASVGMDAATALATIQQAMSLAAGTRHVRDVTGIVLSQSGLFHAAAKVFAELAHRMPGHGYLDSAEDYVADSIGVLSGVEHRWAVDMQITHMEIAARQGNMRDAADIAPRIADALDIHQSRKLAGRALHVIADIRVPRGNRTARENLGAAEAQLKRVLGNRMGVATA